MDIEFSIIVPAYNAEKTLLKCVQSILSQTYSNYELIIVDDGSIDKTKIIAMDIAQKHRNVLLVSGTNKGVSYARNQGIMTAKGRYLLFIDSDDYIDCDLLIKIKRSIDTKNNPDAIMWGFIEEYDNKVVKCVKRTNDAVYDDLALAYLSLRSRGIGYIWHWAIKRTIILDNELTFRLDYSLMEDYDFILNVLLHVETIASIEGAYYHYVRVESSDKLSKKSPYNTIEIHKNIIELKLALFQKINLPNEIADTELKEMAYSAIFSGMKFIVNSYCGDKIQLTKSLLETPFIVEFFFNNTAFLEAHGDDQKLRKALNLKAYNSIVEFFENRYKNTAIR